MSRSLIPEVQRAASVYRVKHFRFPIDVVNYENKTNVPAEARQTCGQCKTFQPQDHIVDHHGNRSGQLEIKF